LLDDLLDVSRITQGKLEFRDDLVDAADVVREAARACRPVIERQGLDFAMTVADEALPIRGDSARLQQMMVNLLTNAAKFTPSGGSIWVGTERTRDQVEIRVRDTGVGIKPEMLERVFDLFVQDDTSLDRSGDGMGVGLSLVRTIVERHGGRVTAHSAGIGRGSEFVVHLPLTSDTIPRREVSSPPQPAFLPSRVRSVVIVEDNTDSRRMLETLLQMEGFTVHTAANGGDGLALILSTRPDLALVDIGLPGLDGFEVARRVRSVLGRDGLSDPFNSIQGRQLADGLDQSRGVERLGEPAVRPVGTGRDVIEVRARTAHDEDFQVVVGRIVANPLEGDRAVLDRHVHVQEDHVGPEMGGQIFQGGLAILHLRDVDAVQAQVVG
jgi:CheY-like chemotaxis protein